MIDRCSSHSQTTLEFGWRSDCCSEDNSTHFNVSWCYSIAEVWRVALFSVLLENCLSSPHSLVFFFHCVRLNPTAPGQLITPPPRQLVGLGEHCFCDFAPGGMACFSRGENTNGPKTITSKYLYIYMSPTFLVNTARQQSPRTSSPWLMFMTSVARRLW